jgi:hypothetical protein
MTRRQRSCCGGGREDEEEGEGVSAREEERVPMEERKRSMKFTFLVTFKREGMKNRDLHVLTTLSNTTAEKTNESPPLSFADGCEIRRCPIPTSNEEHGAKSLPQ